MVSGNYQPQKSFLTIKNEVLILLKKDSGSLVDLLTHLCVITYEEGVTMATNLADHPS